MASSSRRALPAGKLLYAVTFLLGSAGPQAPSREFALKAESPKFWELLDRDASVTRVASGFRFTEGPVWDERGFLYVSDEEQNKIFRVYGDGHKEEVISLGDPDGNTTSRIACQLSLSFPFALNPVRSVVSRFGTGWPRLFDSAAQHDDGCLGQAISHICAAW